jgi:hypothetical protein
MIVNAVHPPVACSPTSSIPALIQLLPAAASSRFRPPPFWPPSCSMPPLRSPLQLRVPPPPVARVPGAPFPTRFALPPPPPPLLCFPFPLQLTRVPFPCSSRECRHHCPCSVPRVSRLRYVLRRRRRRSRNCINSTAEQTPATATSRIIRYVHPSLKLSVEFSLPLPRETSGLFFLFALTPAGN